MAVNDLGCAVRRLRHARRLTIEALAFKADMHPTYLSGIERGRRNPTWAKLCGLATGLDITVSRIALDAEELRDYIDRAQAAGLDIDMIAALAAGRKRDGTP